MCFDYYTTSTECSAPNTVHSVQRKRIICKDRITTFVTVTDKDPNYKLLVIVLNFSEQLMTDDALKVSPHPEWEKVLFFLL